MARDVENEENELSSGFCRLSTVVHCNLLASTDDESTKKGACIREWQTTDRATHDQTNACGRWKSVWVKNSTDKCSIWLSTATAFYLVGNNVWWQTLIYLWLYFHFRTFFASVVMLLYPIFTASLPRFASFLPSAAINSDSFVPSRLACCIWASNKIWICFILQANFRDPFKPFK